MVRTAEGCGVYGRVGVVNWLCPCAPIGRRKLLQCVLDIRDILNSSEPYYILNNLYITDYAIWLQSARYDVTGRGEEGIGKYEWGGEGRGQLAGRLASNLTPWSLASYLATWLWGGVASTPGPLTFVFS